MRLATGCALLVHNFSTFRGVVHNSNYFMGL